MPRKGEMMTRRRRRGEMTIRKSKMRGENMQRRRK